MPDFCEEAGQAMISGRLCQATRKPSPEIITRSKETEPFQDDKEARTVGGHVGRQK